MPEVTENYIRIPAREGGDFEEGSTRTITLSAEQGIKALIGRLKGENKTTIRTYLFDKEKWTMERAQAWVAEHKEGKALVDLLFEEAYKAAGTQEADKGASLAVKMLEETEHGVMTGGYLLLWGDEQHKDLQRQYFTKATDLWLDKLPVVPALFHHGLDKTVDLSVVGRRVKAQVDDQGVWVKHWLDKSSEYWAWLEPLLRAEALYLSPGSAGHLVRVAKKSGELLSYPIVEDTLTPTPAQHRLRPVEQIKAAYKCLNLAPPELGGEDAGALSLETERARAQALRDAIELSRSKLKLLE